MPANDTIRVHIPLTVRKRGGRPRILPPKDIETLDPPPGQDPRVLRAIGRAWAWRQRMERGEITTIADLAAEEGLSDRYVSRLLPAPRMAVAGRPRATGRAPPALCDQPLRPLLRRLAAVGRAADAGV